MAFENTDIAYVLSGGTNNQDPDQSLGGDPSVFSVPSKAMNNLFEDVTDDETKAGLIDYRCIYIFNNHATDALYNCKIYLSSQKAGGSNIQVGILQTTDLQRITITGTVTGGTFTIAYESHNVVVTYDANIGVWGANLQSGLNNLTSLSGVNVQGSIVSNSIIFDVRFEGNDDNRSHELLQLISNNLTGSPNILISKIFNGSPINSTAPDIEFPTVTPFDVEFVDTSKSSPIEVGTIYPSDGFSVWLKRTTIAGTSAIAKDAFILRLSGSPI